MLTEFSHECCSMMTDWQIQGIRINIDDVKPFAHFFE